MRRIIYRFIFLLWFCFCCTSVFSQSNKKIDSLLSVLKTAKEDTGKVNILTALCEQLYNIGNYQEVNKYSNEALLLAKKLNFKKGIASIYNNLGVINDAQGNFPKALKYYNMALTIAVETGDKKRAAACYINIGIVQNEQDQFSEALINYKKALKISEDLKDSSRIATCFCTIGSVYKNQANFPEALKHYQISLEISQKINDKRLVAYNNGNIGVVNELQGNYPEALKNYLNCLKISEELGDKYSIGQSYNQIGIIYSKQKNYAEALKNHFVSLKISEELNDKLAISQCYFNIADTYSDQGKNKEALAKYFVSAKLRKEIGDKQGIVDSYSCIGKIYKKEGKYSEALKIYDSSLKMYSEIGDNHGIAITHNNLGEIYIKLNKLSKAENYLMNALNFSKEVGSKEITRNIFYNLSELDSAQQDYRNAYKHYKAYIIYRDSLLNEENTKKIIQSQMQYEFDKKEASTKLEHEKTLSIAKNKSNAILMISGLIIIILLFTTLLVRQRILKKRAIEKANSAHQMAELQLQSLRAQLNPHFMFNSLNAIQELIVMEENEKSQSYLERFAQLLRQLLDNANQPFIPLRKEINFLEHYLSLENLRLPNLKYSITIDPEVKVENITIPNMMLQPYIENALWHGLQHKQGEKKLELHISRQNGSVQFAIKDNGVGRKKAEEMKSLYRKEHRSKGMELLSQRFDLLSQEYGQQIQTNITDLTENGVAAGTLVEITVPASLSEQEKKNAA